MNSMSAIVRDTRKVRAQISAAFQHDAGAYIAHLMREEKSVGHTTKRHRGGKVAPRKSSRLCAAA